MTTTGREGTCPSDCIQLNEFPTSSKKARIDFKLRHLEAGETRTNDEVHSTIYFSPVMKAILATPQVQRLRDLKQLGTTQTVYMNANHNRFEHSVGVSHLAKQMCERLQHRQPKLNITAKDILCVSLAGLLHDLGHGCFSHIYDGLFPKELDRYREANPDLHKYYEGLPHRPPKWSHEKASLMMIDALLEELGLQIDEQNLDSPLQQIGDGIAAESVRIFDCANCEDRDAVLTSRDWIFIKELILGEPLHETDVSTLSTDDSGFIGRPAKCQEFFYDIVANRHNGLDTDKIDYFARDRRRTFKGSGQIEQRFIEEAFVAWSQCPNPESCFRCSHRPADPNNKHLMICYSSKMVTSSFSFFTDRFRAHSEIYTHKMSQSAAYLVSDIMIRADPYFRIPASDTKRFPKGLPISLAMYDRGAYVRLKDSIIDLIEYECCRNPKLQEEVHDLLHRFQKRDLYKEVGERKYEPDGIAQLKRKKKSKKPLDADVIKEEFLHLIEDYGYEDKLTANDFIVNIRQIHCGAKEQNPVLFMRFLEKKQCSQIHKMSADKLPVAKAIKEGDYAAHTPRTFQETSVRIFSRKSGEELKLLERMFELWSNPPYEDSPRRTGVVQPEKRYTAFEVTEELPGRDANEDSDDVCSYCIAPVISQSQDDFEQEHQNVSF